MLSYAGRLQLIAAILASMQVYWASVFILPKSVIKDIDKLLKGFLWCQGELSRGKAKVAWKQICKPKKEGGLGIKNLGVWNEVLMSKHLWNVASNKESLWVKWINVFRLKEKSIWEVNCESNASRGWKQILSLRDKVKHHIFHKIGNGKSIFMWHDKWWEGGAMSTMISNDEILQANLSLDAKVNDLIKDGDWNWPANWILRYPFIRNIPKPSINDDCADRAFWITNSGDKVNFSIKNTWKDWNVCNDTVPWWKVIWFSHGTPKHSFILWLAVLGRLSTQDRLLKWYPGKHVICPLCEMCPDSHDHLFFECNYSTKIWGDLKKRIKQDSWSNSMSEVIDKMTKLPCNKSIMSILRRIVIAACVYFIWTERNKRLFGDDRRSYQVVLVDIINHVRLKLSSLTVKRTCKVIEVCKQWKVSMSINKDSDYILDKWNDTSDD